MDTIRSYLESMFKNLPLTDKVMRAKSELLQMMEDKYTELIKEGKSENEAVGIVISEFGNLEDLVDDLGIKDIYTEQRTEKKNRRLLSFDEIKMFIEKRRKAAILTGLGVFCCICSTISPILGEAANIGEVIHIPVMFLTVGIGVILFIISANIREETRFVFREHCAIDSVQTDYLKSERTKFISTYSIMKSIGILCCIFCFIPSMIFDEIATSKLVEELGPSFLFVLVGVGVFLIIYSSKTKKSYDILLSLNGEMYENTTFYYEKREVVYKNKAFQTIISVFWPTIICIYLSVSFITGGWHLSWIILPVSGVIFTIVKSIGREN